jgi:hypothetical protein
MEEKDRPRQMPRVRAAETKATPRMLPEGMARLGGRRMVVCVVEML